MCYAKIIVSGNPLDRYQARGTDDNNRVLAVNRLRQDTPDAALAAFHREHPNWEHATVTVQEVPPMAALPVEKPGKGFDQ